MTAALASRRRFLAACGGMSAAAIAVGAGAAHAAGAPATLALMHTHVANAERFAASSALPLLAPGVRLLLRREPENDYDTRAVSVWTLSEEKLGYVPRVDLKAVTSLLDGGVPLEAAVAEIGGTSKRPNIGLSIAMTV